MRKCLACGSDQLFDGDLAQTHVSIWVYTTTIHLFKLKNSGRKIGISGVACSNCGHVQFEVNPKELKQIASK